MGVASVGELADLFILVVEDDPDALNILQSLLTYLGAFITTAATAAHALNVLAQVKVDVVICDVNLGDQDAFWLIEQTRPRQPTTPFIAVSGQDYDEHEMRLAGFSASLTKPLRHELLVRMILQAVGR